MYVNVNKYENKSTIVKRNVEYQQESVLDR